MDTRNQYLAIANVLWQTFDKTYEPEKETSVMCTAATYKTKDFYFGRTLDYEFSYGDEITVTPRNYVFTDGKNKYDKQYG